MASFSLRKTSGGSSLRGGDALRLTSTAEPSSAVGRSVEARWSVRAAVGRAVAARWDVAAQLTAGRSLALSWRLASNVAPSARGGRPRIRLELNFGTGPYAPPALVLDSGRLDVNPLETGGSATWLRLDDASLGQLDEEKLAADALGDGFWTDLADFCQSLSIRSGRRRQLEHVAAARLTAVLDNADRRFDPTNLAGPYVVGTNSAIAPMRPVRVLAEWEGQVYPLAFVYADGWPVSWEGPAWSTTTLTGTDAFKVLADFDPLEVAPVGAGEDTGARIHRILDNAGWSATARDIDTGDSTLQATTLAANTLAELKLATDSELGELFVAPDGRVTFRRRNARVTDDRSAIVQATFGEAGTSTQVGYPYGEGTYGEGAYGGGAVTTVELPYADVAVAYDDETIRNRANIARVGGTVQTASNPGSIARNLTHTHTRSDLLLETNAAAADYARTIVSRHGANELRFDTLVLEPDSDTDGSLWPVALGLRFGDRIRIRRRPPGGGVIIERECFVEGVDHDIAANGAWRTTVHLSDASTTGGLILDHAVRGVLDLADNALTF